MLYISTLTLLAVGYLVLFFACSIGMFNVLYWATAVVRKMPARQAKIAYQGFLGKLIMFVMCPLLMSVALGFLLYLEHSMLWAFIPMLAICWLISGNSQRLSYPVHRAWNA